MQTIWQNPQRHGGSTTRNNSTASSNKPQQSASQAVTTANSTPPQKKAMSNTTQQALPTSTPAPFISAPAQAVTSTPTPQMNVLQSAQQLPSAAPKKKPSGSTRLRSSVPDPVNSQWNNPVQSQSPWSAHPSPYGDQGFGGAFGAPPSPWGASPYGGFGAPGAGFGGQGPSTGGNETPLSKMSEDQRQDAIKKAFSIALGKEPEQKDFNYYKYSVLTESKLLLNLINGTQHKELVEKGQKYNETEKRSRELEMQIKFQDEHTKNTTEEIQLLRKVLQEKNSIIHVLRENINKFQNNPNRVEILDQRMQPTVFDEPTPPQVTPVAPSEPAPQADPVPQPLPSAEQPTQAVPTEALPETVQPVGEESFYSHPNDLEPMDLQATMAPFELPPSTPKVIVPAAVLPQANASNHSSAPIQIPQPNAQPAEASKTLFTNPLRDIAKQLRNLISPPY